jgi:hypothetical protein
MKLNLLLLAAAGCTMTVCNSQSGDLSSPAVAQSDVVPAARLVVALIGNRWTTEFWFSILSRQVGALDLLKNPLTALAYLL